MFSAGAREAVMSVAVADEIQVVGLLWMKRRFERCAPGIGDRSRRKSGNAICVVRRSGVEVRLVNNAVIFIGEQRSIDDGRVGAQQHAVSKAVVIDPSD